MRGKEGRQLFWNQHKMFISMNVSLKTKLSCCWDDFSICTVASVDFRFIVQMDFQQDVISIWGVSRLERDTWRTEDSWKTLLVMEMITCMNTFSVMCIPLLQIIWLSSSLSKCLFILIQYTEQCHLNKELPPPPPVIFIFFCAKNYLSVL